MSIGTLIIPHSPSYFRRQQAAAKRCRNDVGVSTEDDSIKHQVPVPVYRENDKTATELFSYAVIYWALFGISKYLHIGGPDVSRRLVCSRSHFYNDERWSSTDEVGQVSLPYIMWVAAYNTTVLLCYFLLDLAFFPTPLSKSTYSPVSGLKVVRRPNNSSDNDSDSTSTLSSPSSSMPLHRTHASGLSPRMTTTRMAGPSPMPAPHLLEAINRNSLAIFLLVRFSPSHFSHMYSNVSGLVWRAWGRHCRRT